jgi:hypothetical protein
MEKTQLKKHLDSGLLSLIDKEKKGELKEIPLKETINFIDIFMGIIGNTYKKIKHQELKSKLLSDCLIELIPKTSLYNLEGITFGELMKKVSDKYQESGEIPPELIKETLDSMEEISKVNNRYYIDIRSNTYGRPYPINPKLKFEGTF